jgi:hypothetical protein
MKYTGDHLSTAYFWLLKTYQLGIAYTEGSNWVTFQVHCNLVVCEFFLQYHLFKIAWFKVVNTYTVFVAVCFVICMNVKQKNLG